MRVGVLTGGGDAPGLNSVIEAITRHLETNAVEVIGILDGFEGIFEQRTRPLRSVDLRGISAQSGTILGTSNRTGTAGRETEFMEKLRRLQLDGLIAIGGDGTFRGLQSFQEEVPMIGVPKTIDNDLPGTDVTFGFDTACSVVTRAVDSLRATAEAHRRLLFVETMGRTAGWMALGGGIAALADAILIPEVSVDPEALLDFLRQRLESQRGVICVVAEGAALAGERPLVAFRVPGSPEADRLGGVAEHLARWAEAAIGREARHVVLGHLQRSEPPTTTDRFLTLAMGLEASRLALQGQWSRAVVYRQGQVTHSDISAIMGSPRLVTPDHHWLALARGLGIFC